MKNTFVSLRGIIFVFIATLVGIAPLRAQDEYRYNLNMRPGEYNSTIQGIVTGGIGGTYIKIGLNLGELLAQETDLRLMTVVGQGSAQNILDLLKRVGIDFAIVQSDVIAEFESLYPGNHEIAKLAYIAKLYNEEIHLVGRADAEPKSIYDLAGLRVNVGSDGSGTQITARLLLN